MNCIFEVCLIHSSNSGSSAATVETVFIYSANELASYIPPRKVKGKKKKTLKKKVLFVTFETFV